MYFIVVYDIASNVRLVKALKTCRRYLNWIQRSVFEGELTNKQYAALKRELKAIINKEEDSVIFFALRNSEVFTRETFGNSDNEPTNFI